MITAGDATCLTSLASVVADSILELDERCVAVEPAKPAKLNIVLTNAEAIIATRLRNTLYWVKRNGLHDCEICGIPHVHHDPSVPYHAIVIASQPISHEDWQLIPDGFVVTVSDSWMGFGAAEPNVKVLNNIVKLTARKSYGFRN